MAGEEMDLRFPSALLVLLRNNMDLPILSRRSSQTHKETVLFMSAVNDCSIPSFAKHAFA